jgi:hypothetical protein
MTGMLTKSETLSTVIRASLKAGKVIMQVYGTAYSVLDKQKIKYRNSSLERKYDSLFKPIKKY